MASTESWGFRSLAELLRDLGPREGERKVYKKFKELYERAVRYSAGEPPNKWRPPGNSNRQQWLMELAAESLEKTLELRQNRPIQLPSDRQEETHKKNPEPGTMDGPHDAPSRRAGPDRHSL